MGRCHRGDLRVTGRIFDPDRVAAVRTRAAALIFGDGLPQTIGRFTIVRTLGHGGMGTVYLASDPDLDRAIALKVLRAAPGGAHDERKARLLREAQALARLNHPNVVSVYEVGLVDAGVYLVMEYVEGQTLGRWLASKPRAWPEICAVFEAAGRGLVAAHARGLVHRDFKPANTLIAKDGAVKVVDFGLARAWADDDSIETTEDYRELESSSGSLSSSLTRSGATVGTPLYMAPEQHLGQTSPAADQFAFCASLYEALYDARPFTASSLSALVKRKRDGVQLPARPRLPGWLRRLLLRGLAPEPSDRFVSMAALVRALQRHDRSPARRVALGSALVASGAALAIGVGRLGAPGEAACPSADRRAAVVWNADVRRRVSEAFVASGLPIATETRARVEARLNEYVAAWSELSRRHCDASPQEPRLQQHCLDRRLTELRITLETLSSATEETVVAADRLVPSIGELLACDEADALGERLSAPDAGERARVDDVVAQLARVRALTQSGLHDEALAHARTLEAATVDLGHLATRAEVLTAVGLLERVEGHGPRARHNLTAAIVAAEKAGMDGLAARAWLGLSGVQMYSEQDLDATRESIAFADSNASRLGNASADLLADIEDQRGMLEMREGNFERAVAAHQRALALREADADALPQDVAGTLTLLSRAASYTSDFERARAPLRRAEELLSPKLGSLHPAVVLVAAERGTLLARQGEYAGAAALLKQAADAYAAIYGDDDWRVAAQLHNLGNLAELRGDLAEAERQHRRAAETMERALGRQHHRAARARLSVAAVLNRRGKHAQALVLIEEATPWVVEALGEQHVNVGHAWARRARALIGLGRFDDAADAARKALAVHEVVFGSDHVEVAIVLGLLGDALQRGGRSVDAAPHLERVIAR
ncbi:MAG: serine/threonine-protein kinase, partial [Myxococcota bacterium]